MTFRYNDKNIPEKLKSAEEEELSEYCKAQGFSDEQTRMFVQNSLAKMYPEDDE